MPVAILVFGGAGVLCLWFGYAFIDLGHSVQTWGVFGDKFGALNCLFTGLALVGVVAALWHEREQAADRDREHRAILARMEAQTNAMQKAANVTAMGALLLHLRVQQERIERVPTSPDAGTRCANIAADIRNLEYELYQATKDAVRKAVDHESAAT